jgi:hypothetical protein
VSFSRRTSLYATHVGTRAEVATGAGQHDHADKRIAIGGPEKMEKLISLFGRDRIGSIGPIEGNARDPVVNDVNDAVGFVSRGGHILPF